ncbi:MAG: thioredoxin domain-containing protein [Candidatus Levybacteria bacterium]|nr:thioredoxin domain-containing protein [Candidatus Levybacteria bacterium]
MQMEKLTKKEKKELRKTEYQEQLEKEQRKKLINQIGIWGGIVAVIILSVLGLIKLANTPSSTNSTITPAKVSKTDIAIGNKNAKTVLIEYSDFQCPACAYYHPILKQLLSDFNGKILFVYRFFPLQTHKNAMISSGAAYASSLQGKFWEMHDMIFENQNSWAESTDAQSVFVSYAEKLKLNTDKFKKDINSDSTKKFINDQAQEGINIGVNSTPTFFLNYKQIKPQGYEDFKTLIQNELK